MEDADLLKQISDCVYIMEHIGGYNVFIGYYQKLAQNLIKILVFGDGLSILRCRCPRHLHMDLWVFVPLFPFHSGLFWHL